MELRVKLKHILQLIFSVKNQHDHYEHGIINKVITVCGIKIRFTPDRNLYKETVQLRKKYKSIEDKLREQAASGKRIKIAFLVSVPYWFPAKPLFEYLLKQGVFDVVLIVIPDLRFGLENAESMLKQTITYFEQYRSVMLTAPLDVAEDNINLNEIADIIFPGLPYDVSHPKYNLQSLINLGLLPMLVNYGFFRSYYDRYELVASWYYCKFYKIFVETKYNLLEYKKYEHIKGKNTVLTGYCKMDDLFKTQQACLVKENLAKPEKIVMIAPHHSLANGYNKFLYLGNFLKYSDLFLKLPEMFPDIKFIFRPHPALFLFLKQDTQWGKEKTEKYIAEMKNKSNVKYSEGGDYFQDFTLSDGIIQDCGSYLAEYFYTLKPQCYLLKSSDDIKNKFTPLGKECMKRCYIAYNEDEILNFIKKVIIDGKDELKQKREQFAQKKIMLNYPHVSECIADYLTAAFYQKGNKQ